MIQERFNKLMDQRIQSLVVVLGEKAKEYARGDRLHNFKRAAEALGCTPEQACVSFWMKHVVSILDMVKDLDDGKLASAAMWNEKIGDGINYLVLLEALVVERLETNVELAPGAVMRSELSVKELLFGNRGRRK